MSEVVVVEAVRAPIGRRDGSLSRVHAADLLATVLRALIDRSSIDPAEVGQVIGGCVSQVGMQTWNLTRSAWLGAGLPESVAATTVDAQCGSSQQASTLAYGLVAAGVVDAAVACGVEIMSSVPIGASIPVDPSVGQPGGDLLGRLYERTSQFEGAERIADKWAITRKDCDEYGKLSQDRAKIAWNESRFDAQVVPIDVPHRTLDGQLAGDSSTFDRDEGLRETTMEGLAKLRPVGRPNGVHTAGSSSQVSDGAGALLLMTREKADHLGLIPLATIVDVCLVGCDPILMLEGPIPATRKLLNDNGLTINDLHTVEVNEAFASVVLAWTRELRADIERLNPNGGAIALGHPLGGTGAILITKAIHELRRIDGEFGLVTMCCGGGLGTGTLLRRA